MFVRAFERKSGFEMIEVGRAREPCTAQQHEQQRCAALQRACNSSTDFHVRIIHDSDSSHIVVNAAGLTFEN